MMQSVCRITDSLQRSGEGRSLAPLPFLSLLLLLLLSLPSSSPAASLPSLPPVDSTQQQGGYRPLDTLWSDTRELFTDAWTLLQRPLSFDRTDWLLTGGGLAATGGLMLADESIRNGVQGLRGRTGDRIADVGNILGENETGLGVAVGLYLPGLLFDWPIVRRMGRHLGQTLIYSAAIGSLMKHSLGRHRPYLEEGPYHFSGPIQKEDSFLSLPSGHTVVAFSIASSLAADIDRPWATVLLYTAASLTSFSRMYIDRHWSSDVFFAGILAGGIGYGVATLDDPQPEDGSVGSASPIKFGVTPSSLWLTVRW